MNAQDRQALADALAKLEHQSHAMSVATRVGKPMDAMLRRLPAKTQTAIAHAVDRTLQQCLRVALNGLNPAAATAPHNRSHKLMTAATGAVGGFFGLPGLLAELPVTTTLMLHSIAEIARAQGEDLTRPEGALACIQVLAFGPDRRNEEAVESAYYATRAALAQATREATAYLAEKGMAKGSAPALVQFLSRIAARFGIEVTDKVAAQMVPIAGAVGGMGLNLMFTAHFQRLAEGHFTIRRLERAYGGEAVRQEYERLRSAH